MLGKTHTVGGAAFACCLTATTGICAPSLSASGLIAFGLYLTSAASFALLPDIDTKCSSVSMDHKVSSFFMRLFFTHRGFTHSFLCMGLVCAIVFFLTGGMPYHTAITTGCLVGYGSHLLLDSLNKKGVPFFYPFFGNISFLGLKGSGAGDFFTRMILTGLLGCCVYVIIKNMDLSMVIQMVRR